MQCAKEKFKEWFPERGLWSTEEELCESAFLAGYSARTTHMSSSENIAPKGWALETMQIINRLTSNIKDKAFDPDWFLLRQRLEEFENCGAASPTGQAGATGQPHDIDNSLIKRAKGWSESDLKRFPTATLELIDSLAEALRAATPATAASAQATETMLRTLARVQQCFEGSRAAGPTSFGTSTYNSAMDFCIRVLGDEMEGLRGRDGKETP